MSRNEDIDNAIWSDPDFEDLSANATLLYLWSWTNPRCGMAGLYKVSCRAMVECKVPLEGIPAALAELAEAEFAFYEDQVLWVRTRVKRLHSKSPQMAKAIAKDIQKIRVDHPLRTRFLETYGSHSWLRDALSAAYREPIGNLSKNPLDKPNSDTLSVPSGEGAGTGTGKGPYKVDLPEGFPEELRPHLRVVYKVLIALAERKGAKAINPISLANTVMARPRKPLVQGAYDCAAHWDGKAQSLSNVVAAYRNWLDRSDDLAGTEKLNGNGSVSPPPSKVIRHSNRFEEAYKT